MSQRHFTLTDLRTGDTVDAEYGGGEIMGRVTGKAGGRIQVEYRNRRNGRMATASVLPTAITEVRRLSQGHSVRLTSGRGEAR